MTGMTTESDVERRLVENVKGLGGECYKFTSSVRGVPDRVAVLPGGRVVFIETKRPKGGRLSPIQRYQIARMRGLGADVRTVWTKQEADGLAEEMRDG